MRHPHTIGGDGSDNLQVRRVSEGGQRSPGPSAQAVAQVPALPQAAQALSPVDGPAPNGRLLPLPRRRQPMPQQVAPMVVSLPGVPAPVLLPVADNTGAEAWARWAQRASDVGGWPDQQPSLTHLRALDAPARPLPAGAGPLIGIVLAEPNQLLAGEDDAIHTLVAQVIARGGRPVLIPPRADLLLPEGKLARAQAIAALVGPLDGLLGPGGNDVDPKIYREKNRYAEQTHYARDRFEADLVLAAFDRELYALGICRSHQLWNAATGGSLVQDVQKEGYSSLSQRQHSDFGIPMEEPFVLRNPKGQLVFENRVELQPGSRLAQVVGRRSVLTNSNHHQAVRRPGRGFVAVGTVRDPKSGVRTIEATESKKALTAQWHPEILRGPAGEALFDTLIRRAEICRLVKAARSEHGTVDVERVATQLRRHPHYQFDAADFRWLRLDLAPGSRAS